MINFLVELDITVFYYINNTLSTSFLDKIMPFLTELDHWILVYVFLLGWLVLKGGKNGRLAALLIVLIIVATDQINSSLLKDWFGRLRPCHSLDDVNLLVNCGSGKSMPSSHSANNFALATVLIYLFPKYKYLYLFFASLVALSRVYVGVHYPSDILAGALVGISIASLFLFINQRTLKIERFS